MTGAAAKPIRKGIPLSRDAILAADDRELEAVDVPEWGGEVLLRALSGADRDAFELEAFGSKQAGEGMRNVRAKLVSRCIVDQDGNRLFEDADVEALGQKSAAALNRLFEKCRTMNGFTDQDVADLEKN